MQSLTRNILCTLLALVVVALPARASEWQFDGVERVVAIADVHGAYDAMVEALQAADVVDRKLAWGAGATHLVIVGDLLDRGPDSRAAMDLLMRLEAEAEAAGGKVHVLIGNHEAMNLTGDLRYVAAAEYAAFALNETADERERWYELWSKMRAPSDQVDEAKRVVFRQNFPAGFFAHRREFASDGAYGKWLLGKPLVVVINGTAFVHGGLSPLIAEIGLDGVNGKLRGELADYVRNLEILYDAEVLLPTDSFHEQPAILSRFLPLPTTSIDVIDAVDAVKRLYESDVHALDGPLWYRGNVVCTRLIESDKLAAALDAIGAHRVVIGHTPTPGRKVLERLDGRVIEIDTGMLKPYYGGSANVLVIDENGLSVIGQDETKAVPEAHPRYVGERPEGSLTSEQIEALLANGEVISRNTDEKGRDIVTVSDGTHTLQAVFAKRAARGVYPDVAAYRLDRMLELDMVPVTVMRKIGRDDGSLQFLPKDSINEVQRQEEGSGGGAWCPLNEQWDALLLFDVLIYNEGRSALNLLYDLSLWQVMLTDHGRAFSTQKGVPPRLQTVPLKLTPAWRNALQSLTEETLTAALGDVLDKRRIRALANRAEELAAREDPAP